jgi:all-trans-retinol 13,14-reductase
MTPCEKEQGEFATKMIINSIMPYSACAKFADTFTGRRGEEYEAWKQQHIDKVLAKMELLYPGFREQLRHDIRFVASDHSRLL